MTRPYTHKYAWSDEELSILRREWAGDKPLRLWDCLPGRTERAIFCKARSIGLPTRLEHVDRGDCLTWRTILRVLADKVPHTTRQIAALTGLNRNYIHVQLKAHWGTQVRVADYMPGRHKERMWAIGHGKDAKRPSPLSHKEVSRRSRKRTRLERPEVVDAKNARRRLRAAEKAGKLIRRDISASWI